MSDLRVLVVDDNPGITRALQILLSTLGCQVEECHDPLEALKLYQKSPNSYDLVFSDQMMPEMSGQELLTKIRSLNPTIPIILGSAAEIEEAPEGCITLDKPYLRSNVAPVITRLIQDKKAQ